MSQCFIFSSNAATYSLLFPFISSCTSCRVSANSDHRHYSLESTTSICELTCEAERQRDCNKVWDVLVLTRYSTSAIHGSLLLSKINRVSGTVLLLFPKWQPLLLHPQEITWVMVHLFLNTAYLYCGGLSSNATFHALKLQTPVPRDKVLLSSAHLLIITRQDTNLSLPGWKTHWY